VLALILGQIMWASDRFIKEMSHLLSPLSCLPIIATVHLQQNIISSLHK